MASYVSIVRSGGVVNFNVLSENGIITKSFPAVSGDLNLYNAYFDEVLGDDTRWLDWVATPNLWFQYLCQRAVTRKVSFRLNAILES